MSRRKHPRQRAPELLLENRRRGRRVRWICWSSVAFAVWLSIWGADLAQTYGLSPGDGGVLRPAGERWAVGATVAILGLLPLAGMMLYARRYVVRLERSGERLDVTVVGFWTEKTHDYPVAAVEGHSEHKGRMRARGLSVNAPWITLRIAGKRYVVDAQADRFRHYAITQLSNEAARAQAS